MGPKEHARLKAVGAGLEKSIYFGGFPLPQSYGGLPMEWLAVPIMAVMRIFHAYSGNYGVAIILLTIITKVLFFPLTLKSMTSMKAMQTLQPQINALRSKYKSDPQRLQRETMELYRANKVNPLGGCLPMVVQIPIFYALYVALSVSVEMQNAPFICFGRLPKWMPLLGGQDLWICDLAAYDPTYILPLLMGASMFVQQKMQPVDGRPPAGEDDAVHAGDVHLHVPQPPVGTGVVLDALERVPDRPAEVHGAGRQAAEATGPRAQEGVSAASPSAPPS